MNEVSIFKKAEQCILEELVSDKISLSYATAEAWQQQRLSLKQVDPILTMETPGRPEKPELVSPRELERRKVNTRIGHAALIHSICHIEFNAINLAWDAVYRFQDMPEQYYDDWIKVAKEESYHLNY